MNHSEPTTGATPLIESVHAGQLERGFPGLVFEPTLEQEFRQAFLQASLPQIRRNLWIGAVFVICFSLLTHRVLDTGVSRQLDLIRIGLFGPLLLLALCIVYSKWYQRLYPLVCQVGAPVFGIGVTVIAVIGAAHGVSLISTVVLATIFIYLMLGMRFYAATASALLVFSAYVSVAALAGLSAGEMLIDIGVLAFANVVGALVCYNLELANRTHFLESRLLTDTASRDGLTGIHNRRVFDEQLDRMWAQAVREQVPLALMLIDIDHFKAYNDYYGHQAGDECLRQVAQCLTRSARRPLDVTTRYGGEEFAILLYAAPRGHVEEVARIIQGSFESMAIKHLASSFAHKRLTVSIGIACVVPNGKRSHFGFIQLADEALYEAKEQGRDRVVIMDKEYEQLSTGAFRKSATARHA